MLWRDYPQFGELIGKKVRPWHLELWEFIPCPEAAKRKRVSTVENLLGRNRVKRIDAEELLRILRGKKIELNEETVQSCIGHIRTIIERMKVTDRQIRETEDSIKRVVETMNSKLKTEGKRQPILRYSALF